jgi:serine/threonine protein kinase
MPHSPEPTFANTLSQAPSMNASNDETKDAGLNPPNPPKLPAVADAPEFDPPKKAGELGTLGKYRILKELGRGGMGGIYLGYDEKLKRRLAIKMMLPKYADNEPAKLRFKREALAAAQMKHENIVVIYDTDEFKGLPYIAMEYLQGASLDEFLKKNPVTGVSQALRVGREVCSALAAAHKLGAAHRDIKPSNIWLEAPLGKAKVLDFGLVKWLNPQDEAKLTTSGSIIGSPAFMSPEQARGGKIDHRTDIFSLGAVLYRMTTGQLPFQGDNLMDLLMALGGKDPKPVRQLNPKVPDEFADLIHKMLQKNPDHRPQKAAEIAEKLQRIADKRQLAGASGHALPTTPSIRDTGSAGYSPAEGPVVAPIQVSPQEESAFDNLEESSPNAGKGPSKRVSQIETTRTGQEVTTPDDQRPILVPTPRPVTPNRTLFFAAVGGLFVLTFILTVVLVKVVLR